MFRYQDSNGVRIGPYRVWKADEDVPGLAMSRSFGDRVAACVGVIAEPEVSEHKRDITDYVDTFILLGSDGLWDFISNEEALCFVSERVEEHKEAQKTNPLQPLNTESIVDALVEKAKQAWALKEPSRDDITVLLVFLISTL